MGNRAIVKQAGNNIGVYLHWNGGRDSVTAFLKYCELRGFRSFDDSYGIARFSQVVGNFFGGALSVGIVSDVGETQKDAEHLDNGIYVVKGWKIIRQIGAAGYKDNYNLDEMLKYIDSKQPKSEQLGDFLDGVETDPADINIGDIVFMEDYNEGYEKWVVIGFGEDRMVNGRNVLGVPYTSKWSNGPSNPNNYIFDKVRVWKKAEELKGDL